MNNDLIEKITQYRIVTGYLGERDQFGWWQSSFFAQGSTAFLSPIFSRTRLLAQCNGVTRAAALIHDERIGVGSVYHLFRLPEDMEQSIYQKLHQPDSRMNFLNIFSSNNAALEFLRRESKPAARAALGPTYVGPVKVLRELSLWQLVIGFYLRAFENGEEILPYFGDHS